MEEKWINPGYFDNCRIIEDDDSNWKITYSNQDFKFERIFYAVLYKDVFIFFTDDLLLQLFFKSSNDDIATIKQLLDEKHIPLTAEGGAFAIGKYIVVVNDVLKERKINRNKNDVVNFYSIII